MDHSENLPDSVISTSCNPAILLCTFIVFFGVTLFVYKSSIEKRPPRRDDEVIEFHQLPSPIGYPLVGHLTRLGKLPHIVLTEWSKQYGPLFRIKMGFQDVLIISGMENIKKALTKTKAFAGRPEMETSKLISEGLSLTFSDFSTIWEHQKVAAKAAVSLYTTGKDPTKRSVMELTTSKHANNLVDEILQTAKKQGGVLNPRNHILQNASRAICEVCFGKDFNFDDPELRELLSINMNFDKAMAASQPVNFWPLLKHIPYISRSYKNLKIYAGHYWKFITSMLQSHWTTYDKEYMRDLVDCLYYESERQRSNNNEAPTTVKNGVASSNGFSPNVEDGEYSGTSNEYTGNVLNYFTVEDKESEQELKTRITYTTGDIFGAGYDTVFTLLHWAFLYLAVYPDSQSKIREEINTVVSPSEEPSYRLHASKCPYTMAWIYEMLRHCTPSPLILPHSTTQKVKFINCEIPAGVTVYFNAWEAHKNPQIWSDPETFRPERFLIETDGSFSMKPNTTTKLLTWGAGTRKCLGQHLSRHQLFIFISTIARRLHIHPHKSGLEPTMPWPANFGLTLKPHPFKVKVEEQPFTE